MRGNRMIGMLVGIGLLAVSACTQAPPPPPPDTRAQDEAALKKADTDAGGHATARNVDALVATYTDDITLLPPNAPLVVGRDNVKKYMTDMMNLPDFSIAWQPTKAEVARSGDLGYTVGTYHVMFTAPDGNMVMENGKYTTVWRKQGDGSWKTALDMFSSDSAPPPPAAKKK